ncbi:nitroreductase [Sphingobacterium sp.]|uniref:nitroreductase family protein n=1 Tax=Sphingobacterium sp. TaxID=341027 RepID=UPI002899ABEB|nr:nitroreductase [Sphingobacterium sp.]
MKSSYSLILQPEQSFSEPAAIVTKVIRQRRSTYADAYRKQALDPRLLEEILTNATWAPTHKMTEPWRFVVLSAAQQSAYGRYMADYYKDHYPDLSPADRRRKFEYLKNYPLNAAAIIALIFQPSTRITLPEWEEIAAISCAVQNMALTCTAMELGSYWASGAAAIQFVRQFTQSDHEQSFGLFFIGYPGGDQSNIKKRRSPITEKVSGLPASQTTINPS